MQQTELLRTVRGFGAMTNSYASKKVLFCTGKDQGSFFEKVLCIEKNIILSEGKIFLRDDAVNLPLYSTRRKDILSLGGKLFYNQLECKELVDTIRRYNSPQRAYERYQGKYIDHEDYDSKILEEFICASDTLMKKMR